MPVLVTLPLRRVLPLALKAATPVTLPARVMALAAALVLAQREIVRAALDAAVDGDGSAAGAEQQRWLASSRLPL